jgi:hypothetical protein
MVKVIMGDPGAGKTKNIIELVTKAATEETGSVICIETGAKLTYDIPYNIRLIESSQYKFGTYEFLQGFISGLYAGNYDITHIFIDGLFKILQKETIDVKLEEFLDWCDRFSEREGVKFTITMSVDPSAVSPGVKKYF